MVSLILEKKTFENTFLVVSEAIDRDASGISGKLDSHIEHRLKKYHFGKYGNYANDFIGMLFQMILHFESSSARRSTEGNKGCKPCSTETISRK